MELILFKKIPKENKKAYLFSVWMGVGVSILVTIIPNFFSHRTGFENSIFAFATAVPITIATIILLLVLFKWFSITKENIKVRIKCIALMLIGSLYIYTIINLFQRAIASNDPLLISDIITIPVMLLLVYFIGLVVMFFDPTMPILFSFIYLCPFIIVAAYLATKGITNLPKRIILFLIFAFLICATAATPLIAMHGAG